MKIAPLTLYLTTILITLIAFFSSSYSEENLLNSIKAELTTAPNVPAPLKRKDPTKVVIELEATEYIGNLAYEVQYKFWGFNGTVPGPMARVRVGDTVEVRLKNRGDSEFPHNIVIHGVTGGSEGGNDVNHIINPGESRIFTFKAVVPGLFIYHCDSHIPNIPSHMANGMYGLILVEPEKGMAEVDKEFYIIESGFFTHATDKPGIFELSMEKGSSEKPDYVVFNGRVGALTGENALKAKAGESIRIYFANMGTFGVASLHLSGETFKKVYVDGAIEGLVNKNVQTIGVPAGGSTIVELKTEVPSTLYIIDHNLFRISKGAEAIIKVTGNKKPE